MQTEIKKISTSTVGGASGGAWQQNPPICQQARQLVDDMRADLYLAVALEEFARYINEFYEVEAEKVTVDEVRSCIENYNEVKIVEVGGKEVIWLWGGRYAYMLEKMAVEWAAKYREVLAEVRDVE
ncbi:MAG: hypothetical protein ACO2PN_23405 [Pyrobaculum sp.]|jgi:hypothetical protein